MYFLKLSKLLLPSVIVIGFWILSTGASTLLINNSQTNNQTGLNLSPSDTQLSNLFDILSSSLPIPTPAPEEPLLNQTSTPNPTPNTDTNTGSTNSSPTDDSLLSEDTPSPEPSLISIPTPIPTQPPTTTYQNNNTLTDSGYPPSDIICMQIITRACRSSLTNAGIYTTASGFECQEFPTPCDVPDGWEVQSAGIITP